jgi:hypothetical protein
VSPSMVGQVSQSMQDMNSLGMYAQNNNTMLSSHISSLMDPCIFSGRIFILYLGWFMILYFIRLVQGPFLYFSWSRVLHIYST